MYETPRRVANENYLRGRTKRTAADPNAVPPASSCAATKVSPRRVRPLTATIDRRQSAQRGSRLGQDGR
jgi:hypothetical protein